MNRRDFLANAVTATAVAAAATVAFGPLAALAQTSYTHKTLDSTTLKEYPDDPQTVLNILDSEEFKGKTVVIELVAGWCPHCGRLKPEMDAALDKMAAAGADIARLTIVFQEGNHLTGKRGPYAYVNTFEAFSTTGGFPEVHIARDGARIGGFGGERPRKFIEEYLQSLTAPAAPAPRPEPG